MKQFILILALCSPIMAQNGFLNDLLDQLPQILKEANDEKKRDEALEYQRQQTLLNAERLRLERERLEYEINTAKRRDIEAFRSAGFDLLDTNADGEYDLYVLDKTDNGKYEVRGIDRDFNGSIDVFEFDDNEDGVIDRIVSDRDNNGTLEYWLFDNDGDGKWDEAGVDTNGDLLPNIRFPYIAKQ